MTYTIEILKFNTNSERVSGYGDASYDEMQTKTPPIFKQIIDDQENVWYLIFVSCSGNLCSKSTLWPDEKKTFPTNITADDGDIIKAWYSTGGNGHNNLSIYPFIIGGDSGEFFDTGELFVDFAPHHSKGTAGEIVDTTHAWYDTDTMQQDNVTATVHTDLSKFRKADLKQYSSSTSVVVEIHSTLVFLNKVFVLYGTDLPQNNSITVNKNKTCLALAVFTKIVTTGSEEISTAQYSKIPWWEWQEISQKIIVGAIKENNGEIFEYLGPKRIIGMNQILIKKGIDSIDVKIGKLEKLKSNMIKILPNLKEE